MAISTARFACAIALLVASVGLSLVDAEIVQAVAEDDDGLPPPSLPKDPDKPPPFVPTNENFDPRDPLAGLTRPTLDWPRFPEPLPQTIPVAFCDGFERGAFLDEVSKTVDRATDVLRSVILYSSALSYRRNRAKAEIARLMKANDDPALLSAWVAALGFFEKEEATFGWGTPFVEDAIKIKGRYNEMWQQLAKSELRDCGSCPLPKGVYVYKIGSRGALHLPPRKYQMVWNKPGEEDYRVISVSMTPSIVGCYLDGNGDRRISFWLFGGAALEPEYWSISSVPPFAGGTDYYNIGPYRFETLRVTFDDGSVAESYSWLEGPLVPPTAKRATKIEITMRGGYSVSWP